MQWNQLLTMAFSVLGTIALVFYTYPILGVCVLQFDPPGLWPSSLTHVSLLHRIFVPMGMLYWVVSTFYRAVRRLELRHRFAFETQAESKSASQQSSREVKRIDSIMRSHIYTSYGEMLSGMASVRACTSSLSICEIGLSLTSPLLPCLSPAAGLLHQACRGLGRH
jgi:ATP-binding cassette subfamily C (CFTR/MRP) protein 1